MTIELENVVGFNVFRGKHIALNAPDDQLVEVMCTIGNKHIMFDFFRVNVCSYARGSAILASYIIVFKMYSI